MSKEFIEAIFSKKTDLARQMLATPGLIKDINEVHPKLKQTALCVATTRGQTDILKLLLEVPNVNCDFVKPGDKRTAVMDAAREGNIEALKLLIPRSNLSLGDHMNKTAYDLVCDYLSCSTLTPTEREKLQQARSLLRDPTMISAAEHGNLALLTRMFQPAPNHTTAIDFVLPNVNAVNQRGETALYLAARIGYADMIKLLASDYKANVNIPAKNGLTALLLVLRCPEKQKFKNIDNDAIFRKHMERCIGMAESLLTFGATPNYVDPETYETAMSKVIDEFGEHEEACLKLINLLLSKKVDLTLPCSIMKFQFPDSFDPMRLPAGHKLIRLNDSRIKEYWYETRTLLEAIEEIQTPHAKAAILSVIKPIYDAQMLAKKQSRPTSSTPTARQPMPQQQMARTPLANTTNQGISQQTGPTFFRAAPALSGGLRAVPSPQTARASLPPPFVPPNNFAATSRVENKGVTTGPR